MRQTQPKIELNKVVLSEMLDRRFLTNNLNYQGNKPTSLALTEDIQKKVGELSYVTLAEGTLRKIKVYGIASVEKTAVLALYLGGEGMNRNKILREIISDEDQRDLVEEELVYMTEKNSFSNSQGVLSVDNLKRFLWYLEKAPCVTTIESMSKKIVQVKFHVSKDKKND